MRNNRLGEAGAPIALISARAGLVRSTSPQHRRKTMNKNQVQGRTEQAKGKVKEVAGKAVGNKRLETEGKVDQVSGKTEANYGDTKEKAKDAIDRLP
jgi:uncharacterized protein YjbJ (UPF0337 family)